MCLPQAVCFGGWNHAGSDHGLTMEQRQEGDTIKFSASRGRTGASEV